MLYRILAVRGLEAAFRNGWLLSAKWLASRMALSAGNSAYKNISFM